MANYEFDNTRPNDCSVQKFSWVRKHRQEGELSGSYKKTDVDSTFTGPWNPPAPNKPQLPRNPRWIASGPEPITDPNQLPQGWNPDEPDLNHCDIDAQIQRCHERLEDNILPAFFQNKLETYETMQRKRDDMIATMPEGLGLNVALRINSLKEIGKTLESNGDPHSEIPNILAIIDAYNTGKLKWEPGKVSYWADGKPLAGPKKFEWNECERLSENYKTTHGFWIEGVRYARELNEKKYL